MNHFASKTLLLVLAIAVIVAMAPLNHAQVASSVTQVTTLPDGLAFSVDGEVFTHAMGAVWPAGSKHLLYAQPTQFLGPETRYDFTGWLWAGGTLQGGNQTTVTADPTISSYQAVYGTSYSLSVQFSNCPVGPCPSPGTVYVNGQPYIHDATVFVSKDGSAVLQAYPADGYVFAGWGAGTVGQTIQGFQKTITINQPTVVYAQFAVARTINLASIPSGLQILQDRTPSTTPASVQWGMGTTHTLGAVSPQQDRQGNLWVFSSWSDNGASTHGYTVPSIVSADTVTATFVPGALVNIATEPQGLSLNVDGRANWPGYNFTWGVGETHSVSAPAQQTDAQGHIWSFIGWSNGGSESQNITVPAAAAVSGVRLVATYTPVAHLTVNSSLAAALTVNGAPCAVPCDIYQPVGSQVDVAAPVSVALSSGSRQDFTSWSVTGAAGTGTAASGDLVVTLGQDAVTVSPVYHLMNILAVGANPSVGATFSTQPASPDGYYDSRAVVTVKASVLPGYKFRSWSGDLSGPTPTGSIDMAAPRAVTAMLDPVPYILSDGVINGAAVTPQPVVAPGSIVSVFGANLAQTTVLGPAAPLVQALGGVTARVGSQILPLYFVSPSQINFQLPAGLDAGPQTLTISSQGQPDVQAKFTVAADAPGLFPVVSNGGTSNEVTFALATHADGSSVTTDAPAKVGETLTLFGTGFGPTVPARPAGFPVPATPLYVFSDAATINLGGVVVTPSNAYAMAGSIGVDVLQFVVPDGLPSGANAGLAVTINGTSSNIVQLPIQ